MYKNNKGITLLALCVTIAVMLILAGVVVNSLTGNNGLIKVARDTADNVVEEDEAGESQRNSIYSEITAEKDDLITTGAFVTDLQVTANNQTKTISASASVTNQEILSYTFYIKKTTYDDKAYVKIEKADKTTSTITKKVEEDAAYQIKVVAVNKEGKKGTAIQKIVVGDKLKLNVASTTGADSYPDVLLVSAESLENYIDYIQMPDGTKVTASSKYELKTTYNNTKNGPATFIVKDTAGNSKTITYNEQNIPDFTTEWTITEANTTVTVPLGGTTDVYIDYGDGTKENVTGENPTHTYANAGTYTMKISGTCTSFTANTDAQNYMTKLKKWGCLENTSYQFYNCTKLEGTIPSPHTQSFKNVTTAYQLFGGCISLTGEIPTDLFKNATNIVNFREAFLECSNLTGTIPASLFANSPKATNFAHVFDGCEKITGQIPSDLFKNNLQADYFSATFENCVGLTGSIPVELFKNNTKAYYFAGVFGGCSGLTGSIPEELFSNNSKAETMNSAFIRCSGLTGSIPEKLFYNNPLISTFAFTFGECKNLTGSIPGGLFSNCTKVNNFSYTFYVCENLSGAIPEELFYNNPEVTTFRDTFMACYNITEIPAKLFSKNTKVQSCHGTFSAMGNISTIPEGLFDNNTKITDFSEIFYGGKQITQIPEGLFENCTEVQNFAGAFKDCTNLTSIPEGLFDNCQKVTNFGYSKESGNNYLDMGVFTNCVRVTGKAPELWNRTNVTSYQYAFKACTQLSNYADIPDGWK